MHKIWSSQNHDHLIFSKKELFQYLYTLIYVLQQIDWTFCTYLPFSAEAKQLAFFSERCTFEAVCFFTVVETLLGRKFFLCEEGTIGLVELLAFFMESIAPRLIPRQDRDAKLTMYIESWQKDGFCTHTKWST